MNILAAIAEPLRPPLPLPRLICCRHVASWLAVLSLSVGLPAEAFGQELRASSNTAFLQTAGGKRLGTVRQGTLVRPTGQQTGAWREIVLEGWIWTGSVSQTQRAGFDLVVSVAGGENLRDAPSTNGAVGARLLQGFLLNRTGQSGRWTQASRTGWVAASALVSSADSEEAPGATASTEDAAPSDPPPAAPVSSPPPTLDRVTVGERPLQLLVSPDGDTVGVALTGADLAVLAREGSWARVRLSGWVRMADMLPADSLADRVDLSAGDLRANPDEFRGRRVRWTVQFVSLEYAEAVRSDFFEGEPFILARAPDPADGFVYLAVPPELVPTAEGLQPLETIDVLARVRVGRSAVMGAPVLDLLAFF